MSKETETTNTAEKKSSMQILKRIVPLFKPYRARLLFSAAMVGLVGFLVSLMPLFTKHVIDVAIPHKDFRLALYTMLVFLGLMIVRMFAWYIGQRHLLWIRERLIFETRSAVFHNLQELCLKFHHKYSPGYLYDRTLGGASAAVSTFLTMVVNSIITYLCIGIFSVYFCWRLNPGMTVWILVMSGGYVWCSRYFGKRIYELSKEFNLEVNEFAGRLTDILRGVQTIKAFSMEERTVNDFDEKLWPLQLRALDINIAGMRLSMATEGLGYAISAIIVVMGAYLVLNGKILLGTLVAFISYQGSMVSMFSVLASCAGTYGAAIAGLEQIYEVIDARPSVVDKPGAVMPEKIGTEITFEDVHFGYDDKPVIQGMSVVVPPGQSVALVGPSGGGKTTFISLLLRFYDPDTGSIRLGGIDTRDLPLQQYRKLFGVVLQDPFLFNDSIRNNMLAVRPDATDADIEDALSRAQALEFVNELNGKLEYRVGESGSQLSGGQRQRIALARCFLTDPRITILDEATSALDTQSERLVQVALEEMMRDRTVIVIAHRLSTVRNVDRILVVESGCIVQDGAYDDLRAVPGLFQDLHGPIGEAVVSEQ